MEWQIKSFEQLTNGELYEILKIRVDVFVVEQNCPYPEIDNYDQQAVHMFTKRNDKIVAYCRIIPAGKKFKEASIGRVITLEEMRRTGVGTEMIDKAIRLITEEWDTPLIKIEAQSHLQGFYGNCGFKTISEEFLQDGIPHVEMLFERK